MCKNRVSTAGRRGFQKYFRKLRESEFVHFTIGRTSNYSSTAVLSGLAFKGSLTLHASQLVSFVQAGASGTGNTGAR